VDDEGGVAGIGAAAAGDIDAACLALAIAEAGGEIKIFEVSSGKLVVDIKNGHSDTVFGVSFSPDVRPATMP
jgi:WD40 repeat protein